MARKNNNIDIIDKYIGNKIYELRLARGMSRQELGQKVGVTHQQCQKYEKGTNRISAGRLMLIAKVLNKSIEYFYESVDATSAPEMRTNHQRMCIEVSRNFMRIENSVYQDAVNHLVKTLAKEAS
jgi:transcriptional regulator with XRE-family HTH domain